MPGIVKMQVRAIFEAACNMAKKGVVVKPEVMIPLTGHVNELKVSLELLEPVAKQVMEEKGIQVDYKFGTMVEVPRAALTADEVAKYASFFSFGTNDLSQLVFGYSRDDAEGKFLLKYVEDKILPENPFQVLDRDGVGQLMKICVEKGRATRPDLECGICGEHGPGLSPTTAPREHRRGAVFFCQTLSTPLRPDGCGHGNLDTTPASLSLHCSVCCRPYGGQPGCLVRLAHKADKLYVFATTVPWERGCR